MHNNRRLTLEVAGVGYDDSSSLFEMIQRGGHGDTEWGVSEFVQTNDVPGDYYIGTDGDDLHGSGEPRCENQKA
jgi:hypothetical protein